MRGAGAATSVEARTVIALFLRREGKYKEAIEVVRSLKQEYPRDYLFCLEEANLRKDAGEGMAAVHAYEQVVADGSRPGYFAEARLELAYFGLGDALRGQRHYAEAAHAYEQAAWSKGTGTELEGADPAGGGRMPRPAGRPAGRSQGLSGRHCSWAEYVAGRYSTQAAEHRRITVTSQELASGW